MDDGSLTREWIDRTLEVTHWNGDEATREHHFAR